MGRNPYPLTDASRANRSSCFDNRGVAKDGGTLEYVFEADQQNSPKTSNSFAPEGSKKSVPPIPRTQVMRRLIIRATIVVLSVLAARAQSPYDFKVETPMNKLSVPVDLTQTVYAEATKTVGLSFWAMTDMQAPDHLRRFMGFWADSHDKKVTYKITCDMQEQTATVTERFIDVNGQSKESLEACMCLAPFCSFR